MTTTTPTYGRTAALIACDYLRESLSLMNLTDLDPDTGDYRTDRHAPTGRLACSGKGTAWDAAERAIYLALRELLTEDGHPARKVPRRARRVIEATYESGESVSDTYAWFQRHGWDD